MKAKRLEGRHYPERRPARPTRIPELLGSMQNYMGPCVYVHYAHGEVLYVGYSQNIRQRCGWHAGCSRWWPFVDAIEVIPCSDSLEARGLEWDLIVRHAPPFQDRVPPLHKDIETPDRLIKRAWYGRTLDRRPSLKSMWAKLDELQARKAAA